MTDVIDLSLVVPVHNEAATIGASLASWRNALQRTGVRTECIVVDDGSTDATQAALAAVALAWPDLRVMRQVNAGHGAAVAAGYRASRGTWVFQIDGDDEIGEQYFEAMWAQRTERGIVLGSRAVAGRAPVRRAISRVAATYVRLAAGAPVADANVPYRLLPGDLLASFLAVLPADTIAPNLAMTIYAGVQGWVVREVPVVERARDTSRRALGGWRLWRTVLKALVQSLAFRAKLARQSARA